MAPTASFKLVQNLAHTTKNPVLVFGPNLITNIKSLGDNAPEHLKCIPSKIDENKTSHQTCRCAGAPKANGTKFWSLGTTKLTRNLSKSGITLSKPVVAFLRAAAKDNDIDDEVVDRNLVSVVGKRQDMYPLALVLARAFPKFNLGDTRKKQTDDTNEKEENQHREIVVNFVSTDDDNKSDKSGLLNLIDNVREAARIVDAPCNYMHTAAFEDEARKVVDDLNDERVTIEVIQSDELKSRGMGMIHSVGQASPEGRRSRMAILKLNNGEDKKNIAWVGKGIVYDTGGLSIKTKTGMPGMKCDMGGAAGLLFAFKQAVQNGFTQNLFCVLCMAENSVGPEATRPDDIITGYSGLTIEINNTDAEGRLVLGDGVHYATKDLKADICLNMCTLTGAQGITTGKLHAAILTNNEEYEDKFVQAGLDSGDHCYPILYAPDLLLDEFKAPCADYKNSVANRVNAQASCAGHFIQAHLLDGPDYKGTWIHVDMAYPIGSLYDTDRYNGYGVSLMQKAFREYFPEDAF